MTRRNRGAIEEGTVNFVNETEKTIAFAATLKNKAFDSPPSVTLIAAGADNSLLAADKNLLISTDGSLAVTFPNNNLTGPSNAVGPYTIKDRRYSDTLTHSPSTSGGIGRVIVMSRFGRVTVPITSSASITDDGIVQIYFLARFINFDVDGNDEMYMYLINKTAITAATDDFPSNFATENVGLDRKLFVSLPAVGNSDLSTPNQNNIDYRWREINSSTATNNGIIELDATFINNLDGSGSGAEFSGSNFYWFKLELKSLPGSGDNQSRKLSSLGGILFYNTSSTAGENIYLSSVHSFVWDSSIAASGEAEQGWIEGVNLHSSPKPVILTKEKNPGVGVTFSNVTTTGMKITTSAPFTGEIRYLCSVQG
tara:strand:- start:1524 stop:2627 length:1104 start_codon:yes stop_codon:yes gene_type:complete